MGEWLITGLALLGIIAPLLPTWRAALIAIAIFAIGDGILLLQVHEFLRTEPNPGPGARGAVILTFAPTAAFVLGCLLRALLVLARTILRRLRRRAAPEVKRDSSRAAG